MTVSEFKNIRVIDCVDLFVAVREKEGGQDEGRSREWEREYMALMLEEEELIATGGCGLCPFSQILEVYETPLQSAARGI